MQGLLYYISHRHGEEHIRTGVCACVCVCVFVNLHEKKNILGLKRLKNFGLDRMYRELSFELCLPKDDFFLSWAFVASKYCGLNGSR